MSKINDFLEQNFELERQRPEFAQHFAFITIPLHKSATKLDETKHSEKRTKKLPGFKLSIKKVKKISLKDAETMNQLFLQYFSQIADKEHADLHGAQIKIVRAACPQYVGAEGYLIQELPDAIMLCMKDGKVREFPKKHIDFLVEGHHYVIGAHRNLKYKKMKRLSLWI